MLPSGWHRYEANMENITLLADAGDFFLLAGGANLWMLLEIQVFQRGQSTIAVDSLRFNRGVGGAGGGLLTEYRFAATNSPVPTCVATSLPTTDVGTIDWQKRRGWNLLQEASVVPIPELWLPMRANDDLGIGREGIVAHTGVGVNVAWAEYVAT